MAAEVKHVKEGLGADISRADIVALLEQIDRSDSDILKRAFAIKAHIRQRQSQELMALLTEVKKYYQSDKDGSIKLLMSVFQRDKELLGLFTAALANPTIKAQWPWPQLSIPLTSHKMNEVNAGATKFTERFFVDMVDGDSDAINIPKEYEFNTALPPVLGSQQNARGNSKLTFMAGATLTAFTAFTKQPLAKMIMKDGQTLVDGSAFVDVLRFPEGLTEKVPGFTNCTWAYQDNRTKEGLAIVQTGYGFGAGRAIADDPRYYHQDKRIKLSHAVDCSSDVSLVLEWDKNTITTRDALYFMRGKTHQPITKQAGKEADGENWQKTSVENQFLTEQCEVITDLNQVKPGDLYIEVNFVLKTRHLDTNVETMIDPKMEGDGAGGHMAFVAEALRADGSFIGIGVSRNMPTTEGRGLQAFTVKSEPYLDKNETTRIERTLCKKKFFLRPHVAKKLTVRF